MESRLERRVLAGSAMHPGGLRRKIGPRTMLDKGGSEVVLSLAAGPPPGRVSSLEIRNA